MRRYLIFIGAFFLSTIAIYIFFVGIIQLLIDNNPSFANQPPSLIIMLIVFFAIPALIAYYVAFELRKHKKTKEDVVVEVENEPKIKEQSHWLFALIASTAIIGGIIGLLFIFPPIKIAPYSFTEVNDNEFTKNATPSPTSNLSQSKPTITTSPLFTLNISTIDYSTSKANGYVIGAKIRLYDSSNTLLGEKIIPPQDTGSTKSPVATYTIPLGTYRMEGETDTLFGKGTVELKSFNDISYHDIFMYAKSMHINGKLFVDANRNNQYDQGEELLSNQKITAYNIDNSPIFLAGTAITDSSSNFSVTIEDYQGNIQIQPPLDLNFMHSPNKKINILGGQTVNQNLYLWPK